MAEIKCDGPIRGAQAGEALQQFFKEKPDEPVYFAVIDVNANAKVLQSVVLQAKKLGKSIYIFSADAANGKVAHVNAVSDAAKAKGLDGKEWASAVVEILGGKVSWRSLTPTVLHIHVLMSHRRAASLMARKASGRKSRRCRTRWRLRGSTSTRRRPAEVLRVLRGVAISWARRRLR